jgi:biopolymer transport protein ExbB/TolQ
MTYTFAFLSLSQRKPNTVTTIAVPVTSRMLLLLRLVDAIVVGGRLLQLRSRKWKQRRGISKNSKNFRKYQSNHSTNIQERHASSAPHDRLMPTPREHDRLLHHIRS